MNRIYYAFAWKETKRKEKEELNIHLTKIDRRNVKKVTKIKLKLKKVDAWIVEFIFSFFFCLS